MFALEPKTLWLALVSQRYKPGSPGPHGLHLQRSPIHVLYNCRRGAHRSDRLDLGVNSPIGSELEDLDMSSKSSTVRQLFQLLIEKKAWWLVPMVSVFLLLGLLIVMTQGSALSPFIYALF